ncbi:SDR family NAD(P)-dependent oxidoreductase [Anaerobacillus sp. 1_MG-2023]|uniref:SDR family oxidoreductase n=1 Tax=Anaerobacillus sp. 1_MG-2023 TaxID=3062655 RepID=UPI0026E1B16E|nr:SDR family NAD(P)-dependent oxidoreductase [Anaerobacillus sp. 1_MG-2023]MDO6658280.1 SDR family NAD(P)-dependent oxidoreductase [Anaerobacillus sp. 1_MG-2023]
MKKVAVITGGGSGIGEAAAKRFANEGVRVCLFDLKESRAEQVKESIVKNGGEAFVLDVDVADEERVTYGLKQVVNKWGRIDILFNNAGINGTLNPIEEMKVDEWDQTIETNLRSTFLMVKHTIPYMKEDGGSIIITSSINGNRTFSNFGMSAYSTSKAGQVAFMKMAALELAQYHIRVNAICPGAIDTNIDQNTDKKDSVEEIEIPVEYPEGSHPLEQKPGSPQQVAGVVYFLASDASSHVTGTEMYVDGAESLL